MSQPDQNMLPDEKVLWSGRPVKVPFIVPSLGYFLGGLPFMAIPTFALVMTPANWRVQISLFLFPFILLGFCFSFGRTLVQLLRYKNTEYIITDKRVLTRMGKLGQITNPVELKQVIRVDVARGFFDQLFETGDVVAITTSYELWYTSSDYSPPFLRPGILSIRKPYEVQQILKNAMQNAQPTESAL